jgi:hemin uptake protein HemP
MKPDTQKPIDPPVIDAHELLGNQREVRLQFGAEEYRLSITRNQKLILTK